MKRFLSIILHFALEVRTLSLVAIILGAHSQVSIHPQYALGFGILIGVAGTLLVFHFVSLRRTLAAITADIDYALSLQRWICNGDHVERNYREWLHRVSFLPQPARLQYRLQGVWSFTEAEIIKLQSEALYG